MRPDIDVVIVGLLITMQYNQMKSSTLHTGKHVLSEKPVAPDVQGGISLVKMHEYKPKDLRVAEVATW
jgi:predicted dehydrogenase